MALVIEDGTGVAGANSYVTVEEVRSYSDDRGIDLPTEDTDLEKLIVQAMDYLETYRSQYQGEKTDPAQLIQFPREGVVIEGYDLPNNEIPDLLKQAQCQASGDAYDTDLIPNEGADVKKEKVDVIEVEYADSSMSQGPTFTKVESLLQPLLTSTGTWPTTSVRA